ncbi:LOW QUALITY PROTEIN: uncharacterized protein LOC108049007 [Drosophila rhopaloa]|uniref:Uncharacterized protein n=1 Tax=Drosophila rhopaloa TaxID=1041015 RepID=A0ABM5HU89_DRORH|nr:LOW QUALITY PROTEIN: uncharacterized protein LOC108049007 [Drosophila rhopaloa]
MSSSHKSMIPQRVKHSLTALHGPNSRVSRSRSTCRPYRFSLYRSRLPLPIGTLAALVEARSRRDALVKVEAEAVIRSLVRRSMPPAVRGNRTSFRRIQLAHSSPTVASVALEMKPRMRWSHWNQNQQRQRQGTEAEGEADRPRRRTTDRKSPRSLLELVAGKRQPDMQLLRFLCSDHRLINVPCRLIYRHSEVMRQREGVEQPIELRAIRSATLLRVIMWMHQQSGTGNGNSEGAGDREQATKNSLATEKGIIQETCIAKSGMIESNGSGNGSSKNSCENSSENTQNDGTVTQNDGTVTQNDGTVTQNDGTVTQNDGTVTQNDGTVTNDNKESAKNKSWNDCSKSGNESDANSCENCENTSPNGNAECRKNQICIGYNKSGNDKGIICETKDIANAGYGCGNEMTECEEESGGKVTTDSGKTWIKAMWLNNESSNESGSGTETDTDFIKYNHNVSDEEISGSSEEDNSDDSTLINEYSGYSSESTLYQFVNTAKDHKTTISNEISGNGIENGKQKVINACETINEKRGVCTSGQPNLSDRNGNESNKRERCKERSESDVENHPEVNAKRTATGFRISSWEERLLGSELRQLVELILAAKYLGIDTLTLHAAHYFGELMSQRTRLELRHMLRISACLAEVRQALDKHRTLIREVMSSQANSRVHTQLHGHYPARSTPANREQLDTNFTPGETRTSTIRRQRCGRRFSGGHLASEPMAPLCATRHRHHQQCFHSRI